MAKVTIYTKFMCPYCARALDLLRAKGAEIEEIDGASDAETRAEMNLLSGRNTFPQIFIGGAHVGGCDDLLALERQGGLDPLLAA